MKGTKPKRLAHGRLHVACIAPGIACAQSSVTLQGVIDAGVTYVNNQHGGAATLFDSGVLSPDLLTFKGSEDWAAATRRFSNSRRSSIWAAARRFRAPDRS